MTTADGRGLPIASGVIEALGGTRRVQSELGRGASFSFALSATTHLLQNS
ncbi:MAG: hypothetical protein FJ095_14785 [Deltaproteobacteria bacterium]|nr:hypothetical protein [Deltaproteobacteria bacterium]